MKVFRLAATFLCVLLLASCANHGFEHHFENPSAAASATNKVIQPGLATVYLFREKAYLQSMMLLPLQPFYFAVDGRMLSIMPVGSYVVLSLEPGVHTFTRITASDGDFFPLRLNRTDIQVRLEADQTYYVGSRNGFPNQPFVTVEAAEGKRLVNETNLAKLIHQPVSDKEFTRRVMELSEKRKTNSNSSSQGAQSQLNMGARVQSVLPSAAQVSAFLEVLATIALVAVVVVGASMGGSAMLSSPPPANFNPQPQSVAAAPARPSSVQTVSTWKTSTGTLSEVIQSKERTTIHDTSTGIRYSIESGQIRGTDGSRYRVIGPNVFSESGASYQVIGNTIFSSDGRSCVRAGSVITCQ